MLDKVYIWNDLHLIKKDIDINFINNKLEELRNIMDGSVCILNKIDKEYAVLINRLNNIVTIGSRPKLFINKNKRKYEIYSKRVIGNNGFAVDCKLIIDEKIFKLSRINIIEDIIVSGTTITKIVEELNKKNNSQQEINLYFLIGYESAINKIKEKFKNINIYCFNILKEEPIEQSTCIFLSDILYEKLGQNTYIEHIRNEKVFGDKTEIFISKMKEIRDSIELKAGIVTITLGVNYGNRLQNYALQEMLRKFGIKSTTFKNIYQEKEISKKIKRYIRLWKKNKQFKLKLQRFKDFNKKYINMKYTIKSYHVPKKLNEKFDYFICGSDQIWNPYFSGNTGTNFLMFADENKTISYAPSFGTYNISKERKNEFKKYLNRIKYLSCREEAGVDIIQNITNRKAQLVLDPTLLLSSEEWDRILEKPNFNIEKDYIVTYFLGNKDDDYKKYIEEISKKYRLKVFDIMNMSDINKFSTNPSEFLYLIKNCKLVCTDSFHGTVFSIIYNKPYIIFNRRDEMENMNSRFETIKNILELPNRNYYEIDQNNLFTIEYENINKKIKEEKEKSIEYLKNAINYWE